MIDDPSIFCGDDSADVEMEIVQICDIDLDDYFSDERVLTREKFHEHIDEILGFIEGWAPDFPEYNNIAWHVLGAFILKLGASLPGDVKDRIITSTNWEVDKKIQWPDNWIKQRKFYLEDLREKIKNHKTGVSTYLSHVMIIDDKDFKKCCIGIENLKKTHDTNMVHKIEQVYLGSTNLISIPEEVYDFPNLGVLSLEGNYIQSIPSKLKSLEFLNHLFLKHNKIKTIPEFIMKMGSLKSIDLSYNIISEIPPFLNRGVKPKKDISLYNNLIKDFPEYLRPIIFNVFQSKE
ncbi:MAG: leucine-rich repeat domain-containing protein [Promethearchaeota archaeon]